MIPSFYRNKPKEYNYSLTVEDGQFTKYVYLSKVPEVGKFYILEHFIDYADCETCQIRNISKEIVLKFATQRHAPRKRNYLNDVLSKIELNPNINEDELEMENDKVCKELYDLGLFNDEAQVVLIIGENEAIGFIACDTFQEEISLINKFSPQN